MLSLLFAVLSITRAVVHEKERRLKEAMRTVSLSLSLSLYLSLSAAQFITISSGICRVRRVRCELFAVWPRRMLYDS